MAKKAEKDQNLKMEEKGENQGIWLAPRGPILNESPARTPHSYS